MFHSPQYCDVASDSYGVLLHDDPRAVICDIIVIGNVHSEFVLCEARQPQSRGMEKAWQSLAAFHAAWQVSANGWARSLPNRHGKSAHRCRSCNGVRIG